MPARYISGAVYGRVDPASLNVMIEPAARVPSGCLQYNGRQFRHSTASFNHNIQTGRIAPAVNCT